MPDKSVWIAGELECWPPRNELASILKSAGPTVVVNDYAIRVTNCPHFVFRDLAGDAAVPRIDADADTVEEMLKEAELVSSALAQAGMRHRFEIYGAGGTCLLGYLHHQWPRVSD